MWPKTRRACLRACLRRDVLGRQADTHRQTTDSNPRIRGGSACLLQAGNAVTRSQGPDACLRANAQAGSPDGLCQRAVTVPWDRIRPGDPRRCARAGTHRALQIHFGVTLRERRQCDWKRTAVFMATSVAWIFILHIPHTVIFVFPMPASRR